MRVELAKVELSRGSPAEMRARIRRLLARHSAAILRVAVTVTACGCVPDQTESQLLVELADDRTFTVSTRGSDEWDAVETAVERAGRSVARRLEVARLMQHRSWNPPSFGNGYRPSPPPRVS